MELKGEASSLNSRQTTALVSSLSIRVRSPSSLLLSCLLLSSLLPLANSTREQSLLPRLGQQLSLLLHQTASRPTRSISRLFLVSSLLTSQPTCQFHLQHHSSKSLRHLSFISYYTAVETPITNINLDHHSTIILDYIKDIL